jgi:hypothetical protein
MRIITFLLLVIASSFANAQAFACPDGQADIMKYFVMDKEKRVNHFLNGKPNPIYTQVFPNQDFSPTGYWFWPKSPYAHGFDVKAFGEQYIYMRSTELEWKDNRMFKRFVHDLPIAARCVAEGKPGPEIKVEDTNFRYFSSCRPYKTSKVGKAVNDLGAPSKWMLAGISNGCGLASCITTTTAIKTSITAATKSSFFSRTAMDCGNGGLQRAVARENFANE